MIALSVILEGEKFAQAYVAKESIIVIQEDVDNKNRCYILLNSGHDMHIDLAADDLKKMVNG